MNRPIDPVLLVTFATVADLGSFTRAAALLNLSQSAVSQHLARLENRIGRRLIDRDTHSVKLTPDGDVLLSLARTALDAQDKIGSYFSGSELRGRIRLGASEDFVMSALPKVLSEFTQRHNRVDLELTVGLSGLLYEKFDSGDLDLIFAKRRRGDERGRVAWSENIGWVGRPGFIPAPDEPLHLVLYPPPSVTRELAISALENAKRSWRAVCTSGSLNGLRAGALAGLGITPHSLRLIPPGLAPLPASSSVPALGKIEFVVIHAGACSKAILTLAETILSSTARIRLVESQG